MHPNRETVRCGKEAMFWRQTEDDLADFQARVSKTDCIVGRLGENRDKINAKGKRYRIRLALALGPLYQWTCSATKIGGCGRNATGMAVSPPQTIYLVDGPTAASPVISLVMELMTHPSPLRSLIRSGRPPFVLPIQGSSQLMSTRITVWLLYIFVGCVENDEGGRYIRRPEA